MLINAVNLMRKFTVGNKIKNKIDYDIIKTSTSVIFVNSYSLLLQS